VSAPLGWSEEHLALRERGRDFARAQLDHDVVAADRERRFPREAWRRAAEFGLLSAPIPAQYGGQGLDRLSFSALLEGVGEGCRDGGLLFALGAHTWGCAWAVAHHGSDALRDRWLPGLLDGSVIGAHGATEPDSGSDVWGLRTTVTVEGDEAVLRGSKTFVTNGPVADVVLVYARTPGTQGLHGVSSWLVPADAPGVTLGPAMETMGLRTSPVGELFLDEARVPVGNQLAPGATFHFQDSLEHERAFLFAPVLGAMTRQLGECVAHARRTRRGGRRLTEYGGIARRLVDMKTRIEAGRALQNRAALALDRGRAPEEANLAKVFLSEAWIDSCRDAMAVFGGSAFLVEQTRERELRDALAGPQYSGSSDVLRGVIAGVLDL